MNSIHEKIINLLKENSDLLDSKIIDSKLNISKTDLENAYLELKENNQVVKSDLGMVYLIGDKYKAGVIKINTKGFGFVKSNNVDDIEDVFVPAQSLNNSLSTDEVVVSYVSENGKSNGKVVDVLQRTKKFLIGEMKKSFDGRFIDFIPSELDFSNYRIVVINKKELDLKPDQIVKFKIINIRDRKVFGKIVKIIGNSNKAVDRISSIAYEFEIEQEFKKPVLDLANKVVDDFSWDLAEIVKRKSNSIEDLNIVTIDGAESKDLDDAVYVEKLNNGDYKLIVAIADVSYFVKPTSELDNCALFRGNSVYLANKVIPMLPEILSNGVCSLNPNEKKLCIVSEMIFDKYGNRLSTKIYESIMISKARLTYSEVNDYFKSKKSDREAPILRMLDEANELYKILAKKRIELGSIEFDVSEPKIILDDEANVIQIKPRESGDSEKLIENFMVSANEAVASIVFEKKLPYIYRNHPKPKEENLIEWFTFLRNNGIDSKLTDLEKQDPKNIRKALLQIDSQISNPLEKEIMNITLLRYMEKALYELPNIGHFGLGSDCYTHFTSPIRRYSDLMVHRYLKQYIIKPDLRKERLESNERFIQKACTIINETERRAVSCEREVNKVCMAEYMTKFLGQEFDGIISGVIKFGLFVQLKSCVEGLVHITELGGFTFDEKANIFVDPQNKIYKLGQEIKVKVKNADVKKRVIDFTLV